MEGLDLTPAVFEELAYAHHTGKDLVEGVGFAALSADFFALGHLDYGAGSAHRLVLLCQPGRSGRQGPCGVVMDLQCSVSVHGASSTLLVLDTGRGRAKKL